MEAEGVRRDVHGSSPQQHQSSRAGSGGGEVWEEGEGMSSPLAGNGEGGGVEISSKTRATAAKTFSYAQALKTSLADSSWSTSRSHTPSETSLILDTRTPTPVQVQVPSPTTVSVPTPNSLDSPAGREDSSPSQLSSPLPSTGNTASPESTEEKVPAHGGDDVIITSGASPEGEVAPVVTSKESVGEDSQPLNDLAVEEGEGKEVSGERKEDLPATAAAKSEETSGRGLQQAPPPGQAQTQVHRGTPEHPPNPLPPQPAQESMATRQVEPLLQTQPSAPVSSLDQPVLPQKQWLRPLQAQVHTRQPRLVEQPRLQASRPDLLSSVQSKPQHLQLQAAQLQFKQQQLQQLILMARKQQPQLLHQQHSQRVLQHRQQGFYESASIARLPTPHQPLQLVGARPLMTTPTHQGLAVASPHQMPHPQSLFVLQSPHLQHPFHPPLPQQTHLSFTRAPTTQEVRKTEHPANISPPGLPLNTSKQVVHSPANYRGDGSTQVSIGEVGENMEGNGESRAGLSVTASPFIPGGRTEQSPPVQSVKKISPPLVDIPPYLVSRPPGFEPPQLPRPVLLQRAVLPAQPLSLTAVRPITTIQAPPRPTLPLSLPPPHPQLTTLRIQPPLAKPLHHLSSQAPRLASVVPTRPVSFYQFHHPQNRGGETILLHKPTHHQKVTPSLSDSIQGHSLVDQAKLLHVSSIFHPQGHAGLIHNPYTAGGVTFVPPVAIPTASLTTPTPTPALSLAKGGSVIAGRKPLLPTPTAPQAIMTGTLSSGTPRLSLAHRPQDPQALQHSYH